MVALALEPYSHEPAKHGHKMQPSLAGLAQTGGVAVPGSSPKGQSTRRDNNSIPYAGDTYAIDDLTAHLQGLDVFSLQQQHQPLSASLDAITHHIDGWQAQPQPLPQRPLTQRTQQEQMLTQQQLHSMALSLSPGSLSMSGALLQGATASPYDLQGLLLSSSHDHSRTGSRSSHGRARAGSAGSLVNMNGLVHGLGSSTADHNSLMVSDGNGLGAMNGSGHSTLHGSMGALNGSMGALSGTMGAMTSNMLGSSNALNSMGNASHAGAGSSTVVQGFAATVGPEGRGLGGAGSSSGGSSGRSDAEQARQGSSRRRRVSAGVMEAASRRTVYVSCLDAQVDETFLALFFERCVPGSEVVDCRVCGDPAAEMRFAFVEFADEASGAAALSLSGTVLGMFPIRLKPSRTAIVPVNQELMPQTPVELERCLRTVYVSNIDKGVEKATLRAFFQQVCGPVVRMQQHGTDANGPSNTNIAFIELLHAQGALAALNCNGMLLGSRPLRVAPSRTPVRTRAGGRTKRRAGAQGAPRHNTPPTTHMDNIEFAGPVLS